MKWFLSQLSKLEELMFGPRRNAGPNRNNPSGADEPSQRPHPDDRTGGIPNRANQEMIEPAGPDPQEVFQHTQDLVLAMHVTEMSPEDRKAFIDGIVPRFIRIIVPWDPDHHPGQKVLVENLAEQKKYRESQQQKIDDLEIEKGKQRDQLQHTDPDGDPPEPLPVAILITATIAVTTFLATTMTDVTGKIFPNDELMASGLAVVAALGISLFLVFLTSTGPVSGIGSWVRPLVLAAGLAGLRWFGGASAGESFGYFLSDGAIFSMLHGVGLARARRNAQIQEAKDQQRPIHQQMEIMSDQQDGYREEIRESENKSARIQARIDWIKTNSSHAQEITAAVRQNVESALVAGLAMNAVPHAQRVTDRRQKFDKPRKENSHEQQQDLFTKIWDTIAQWFGGRTRVPRPGGAHHRRGRMGWEG